MVDATRFVLLLTGILLFSLLHSRDCFSWLPHIDGRIDVEEQPSAIR